MILNDGNPNGGDAQWVETQQLPAHGGVRTFFATFLVQHAPGRTITSVRVDRDFDGTDDTSSASTSVSVAGQTYVGSAGGIETSKVTVAVNVGEPSGLSCPPFGTGTRSVDAPIRVRVVDSTGELSATEATTVRFIADENCPNSRDWPRLTSASQSTGGTVNPGQNITYVFTCDDADPTFFSSDDDCDRAAIRWRRLNDGEVSGTTLKTGISDNTTQTHTMWFPSRGHYVVEARFGNEDGSFPQTQAPTSGWWRLGNAIVNGPSSSMSGSISFSGTQPSNPPSVNAGDTVSAHAAVADINGAVQILEWDAEDNGTFERIEYTVPFHSGGNIVHPPLTASDRTQSVDTASPGLKSVRARITDSGALDGADTARRQITFASQLRVNAIPTATGSSVTTNEDTPVEIALAGSDADVQPEPLVYEIVSSVPASDGTLGAVSGNTVNFTPAEGFVGTTSFTFRTRDGGPGTTAAWAVSDTATVTITVIGTPDPTADAGGPYDTQEGTNVVLDGAGSAAGSDPSAGAITAYDWDLDNDGQYDDASGDSPTFTSVGQDGVFTIGLQVTDANGRTDTDTATVTVTNVAPTVAIDPMPATDELDTTTISGVITDPGWKDVLTATIDFDDGRGPRPLAGVLDNDRPDGTFTFSVDKQYGDDGVFNVTVEGFDDDTSQTDTENAPVDNLDPIVAIGTSGEQVYDGVSAFVLEPGLDITVPVNATDPGSDDLEFTWNWGDGTSDSHTSLVNDPLFDSPKSPSVQPRDVTLEQLHALRDACLYDLTVEVEDDDGGSGADAATLVVTGSADTSRGSGYWLNQYRHKPPNSFTVTELQCYLDIVSFFSLVFDGVERDGAITILNNPAKRDPRTQFDQQAMAAWLNFANGAVRLDTMVDTTGDGVQDMKFGAAMLAAENIRLTGTDAEIREQKDVVERIVQRDGT